jgi:hypothetical protein
MRHPEESSFDRSDPDDARPHIVVRALRALAISVYLAVALFVVLGMAGCHDYGEFVHEAPGRAQPDLARCVGTGSSVDFSRGSGGSWYC